MPPYRMAMRIYFLVRKILPVDRDHQLILREKRRVSTMGEAEMFIVKKSLLNI